MEIEVCLILIALVTLLASFVQSVTGFAFGIIAMVFLPSFLLYTEANVLSTVLSTFTSLLVVVATYRKIHYKNLVFPLIGSFVANYFAVTFAKTAKTEWLVLLLGVALFVLSVYFFFFSNKIKIRARWYTGLIAGLISGVMSGLFSIGGPPVVVYYMQSEKDTESYLATISAYFILSGIVSATLKITAGFLTQRALYGIAVGFVAMLIGAFLGKKTRNKVKPQMLKKAVYGVMAISGLINIITSLV